ncbi:phage/plasmid primase, P4 family [Planctomycetota bacterium]
MAKSKDKQQFYRDPVHLAEGLLSSEFFYMPPGDSEAVRKGAANTLAFWRGDFYHWQKGVYRLISESDIRCEVVKHMRKLKEQAQNDDEDVRITTGTVNNLLLCLKELVHLPADRSLNSWPYDMHGIGIYSVAVENGIMLFYPYKLDPKPALKSHSPHFFNVAKLACRYDSKAECPMWEAFLEQVMCGDAEFIELLQQWTGYLLLPDMRHHKFLLNAGEGGNGKSVFVEVLQGLLGVENCSTVPLARFGNPFALYGTYGKLLNATDETTHIVEEEAEATMKRFVTGQTITFERKFRDSFEGKPTAKLMINTNALPRFNDKTSGTWRRLLLVPWEYTVPEDLQIKDFAGEICKKELPGILNWALAGLASLNSHNGFVKPSRTEELIAEYRRDSDPTRTFLEDHFAFAPNAIGILCQSIYDEYREWCGAKGYRPVNNANFGQQVRRIFPSVKRVRPGSGATRPWRYDYLTQITSQTSFNLWVHWYPPSVMQPRYFAWFASVQLWSFLYARMLRAFYMHSFDVK